MSRVSRARAMGISKAMSLAMAVSLAMAGCGHRAQPRPALVHRAEPARASTGGGDMPDRDGDGIPDDRDGCPTDPEDFDLHDDTDGCPDPDDDHDGVPDEQDACFDTPGRDTDGCPDGCTRVVTNTDCFITAIWSPEKTSRELAETAKELAAFPEIREVTLRAVRAPGEAPALAATRIEHARAALIAAGVPAAKLAAKPQIADSDTATAEVFGLVTKQRFTDGRFRELVCAGGMGEVYKVARPHNYHCPP